MQNKSSVGLWEMSSLLIDADKNLSVCARKSENMVLLSAEYQTGRPES